MITSMYKVLSPHPNLTALADKQATTLQALLVTFTEKFRTCEPVYLKVPRLSARALFGGVLQLRQIYHK